MNLIERRRQMMMSKSLPYDAEIEYLESSGTQYIDLGIVGNGNIVIDAKGIENTNDSQVVFGTTPNGTGGTYFGKAENAYNWGFGNSGTYLSNVSFTNRVTANINLTNNGMSGYVDDSSINRSNNVTHQAWTLFSCPTGAYTFSGYVYSFKGYQNDVLVRDMIPVRVGSVGYMYDRVSGQLFGNSGTGVFVAGPDKGIIAVEYLQSEGTQYIDLGYSGNVRIVLDAQCTNVGSASRIVFGTDSGGVGGTCYGKWGNNYALWACGSAVGMYVDIYCTTRATADLTFSGSGVTGSVYTSSVTKNLSRSATVTQGNWTLFACPSGAYPFYGKIFSAKMYHDDLLVMNLIPVRIGVTGYMIDLVSRQLFGNSGTGSFTLGPDK